MKKRLYRLIVFGIYNMLFVDTMLRMQGYLSFIEWHQTRKQLEKDSLNSQMNLSNEEIHHYL